jgi:light-regulated signal transduction histidine kinase (bacteriophytochrome)
LRAIDGFSQALLEDCSDRLDEQGRNHLARVLAGVQRMSQLIDDILNLSRTSRAVMERAPIDLSAIAQVVVAALRQGAPQRQVEVQIAPDLRTNADPHLMQAVLENLLGNAWKFTARRDPARIEFGCKPGEDGKCVYFVKDNGAGFDMKYADKLFGVFQRLHNADEFPGTGIGLANVQRIIRKHGGRIWAEAAVDHGATFYFTL